MSEKHNLVDRACHTQSTFPAAGVSEVIQRTLCIGVTDNGWFDYLA